MALYLNFTEWEINHIKLFVLGQRHRANDRVDGEFDAWDGLLTKIQMIQKHPMCCWCDARDWSLDDPDTIPEAFGCQHNQSDLVAREHCSIVLSEGSPELDALRDENEVDPDLRF